jgi:hypothetical protein
LFIREYDERSKHMLQIAGATMQTVQGTVRLYGSPSDSAAVINSGTGSPSMKLCAGLPGEEPDTVKPPE